MADSFMMNNGNGRPPPDPPHVANMSVTAVVTTDAKETREKQGEMLQYDRIATADKKT